MAIRKDIDDMLNSLMSTPESAKKAAPAPKKPAKKNKYDEMSVDDLLNALTGEKNSPAHESASEIADEIIGELSGTPAAPAAKQETTFEEELNIISSSSPAEEAPAPAPAPKKKKIVISGELPDYEAIRARELEKDRLAREQEAAAKAAAERTEQERLEREAAERAEQERLEREAAERAEKERLEREAAERAEKERLEREAAERAEQERLEREAAERAEKERLEREAAEAAAEDTPDDSDNEPKKGFFSKIKDMLEHEDEEETDVPGEDTDEADEAPAEEGLPMTDAEAEVAAAIAETESISEKIISDIESAEDGDIDDIPDDTPSAEELVDAAIAALTLSSAENEPAQESQDGSGIADEDNIYDSEEDHAQPDEAAEEPADEALAEPEIPETQAEAAGEEQDIDVSVGQEKPKGRLTSALEKVLGEDPDELAAERREKVEDDDIDIDVDKPSGKAKKRIFAVLGVIFSIFAVIGIITVIAKGASYFSRFTSGEVKKDGFTEAVYPAVIMDIEAFNSPSELSSERILTAAIWSVIMDDSKISKYEKTFDVVAIPEVEVEKYAVELFGSNIPALTHCTVGPPSSPFYYDSSKKAYNVPVRPMFYSYSPDIKSVSKSGSEYTVTVDYIEERPSWMESSTSKTVEFRLTENSDGSYRINSMKILSASTI